MHITIWCTGMQFETFSVYGILAWPTRRRKPRVMSGGFEKNQTENPSRLFTGENVYV